jgi:phage minor structural protein
MLFNYNSRGEWVMRYLECFDKNFQLNGFLQYADQVQRKRRLNSDYGLSFLVPMNSDDYMEKISLKGHVQDEKGQYYVINGRKRNRDGLKRMAQIDCTHIMFKLVDFKMPYASYIEESFGVNISVLTTLITTATAGKFTFSIDSTFDLKDVKDFGRGNCMEALVYIINTYGCEVDPNNFVIHLKKQIGSDHGLQYRFKKNIISSTFEDSVRGLVTRMYGEMKDGLTFIGLAATNLTADEFTLLNAIPGAIVGGIIQVNYLISPFTAAWSNTTNTYFDGEHIDQNIEDQLELLKATRAALAECQVPSVDVTINAADLFKLDSSEPQPNLGDIAYSIDPLMELNNISARVVELTEYPFQMDKHTDVRLANFMLKDRLDYQAEFDATKRTLDGLISGGKVRTNVFEDFAKQAVIDINNSKTEIIYDGRGILLQEKTNILEQVILASKGIYLTVDGGLTSEVAITAAGIVAEMIRGTIGIFADIVGTNITGSLITGATITSGSTINIATDATVGKNLYVGNLSPSSDSFISLNGGSIQSNWGSDSIVLTTGGEIGLTCLNDMTLFSATGDIIIKSFSERVLITAPGGLWVNGTFIA